eukprot:768259-Hanusia_phi.AAC.7
MDEWSQREWRSGWERKEGNVSYDLWKRREQGNRRPRGQRRTRKGGAGRGGGARSFEHRTCALAEGRNRVGHGVGVYIPQMGWETGYQRGRV